MQLLQYMQPPPALSLSAPRVLWAPPHSARGSPEADTQPAPALTAPQKVHPFPPQNSCEAPSQQQEVSTEEGCTSPPQ